MKYYSLVQICDEMINGRRVPSMGIPDRRRGRLEQMFMDMVREDILMGNVSEEDARDEAS